MKICWDNLERVNLSINGNLRVDKTVYVEMPSCKLCGEPYLTPKSAQASFCSLNCTRTGGNNPFFGKTHISKSIKKISEKASHRLGKLNPNYRGGVAVSGFTVYTTYEDRLGLYENIREQKDTGLLETTCAYCGQWFMPKRSAVTERLKAVNCLDRGELRLYCSINCKRACPTYGMRKYPKGFKKATSREVNPYLRQMVFERDGWGCQKCGKTIKDAQLHCHHMDPVAQNPMFQNDVNSCITLCKDCHEEVHMRYGCRYIDLRCKKEE